MITVKIPAAIGESSPVIVTDPDGHTLVGVVAMMWDGPWVTIHPTGGEQPPYSVWIPGWVGASIALDISRTTGAAHLAWWLQTQPKHAKQAAINAMQIKGLDLLVVAEQAINGMPIDEAGLALLHDYAHRVAGVSS